MPVLVRLVATRWQSPLLLFPYALCAPSHTVQYCMGGESMATCVNLTDWRFELRIPKDQGRSPLDHLGGWIERTMVFISINQ